MQREFLSPQTEQLVEQFRESKVREFQECLGTLNVTALEVGIDKSADDPASDAEQRFYAEQYDGASTFYVVEGLIESAQGGVVGFTPYKSRSGNASFHGVFFGELHFAGGSGISVAVKPHDNADGNMSEVSDRHSCLKDYFTNAAAKEMGFESLQPVGFILSKEGVQYSLTQLEETLDCFDTIEWGDFFKDGFENVGMREMWYKAALQAAMLHNNGNSRHGDMAARNIATNSEGHIFFIDWEHGQITDKPPLDIDARFGYTLKDIKSLMVSMTRPSNLKFNPGIGIFKSSNNWWGDFKDLFLDDYMESRLLLASQGSHHMKTLNEAKEELQQLEYTLKLEMDRLIEEFSETQLAAA